MTVNPWNRRYEYVYQTEESERTPEDLISICIPHFNYGDFIGECLDSVLGQTHKNLELIVVDDCSEDISSVSVISDWADRNKTRFHNVSIIRNMRNAGPSVSRNIAVDQAAGEFILLVDADNILFPRAAEKLLSACLDGGFDAVYPQITEMGDRLGLGHADIWDPDRLRKGNYIDVTSLLRKKAFQLVGGFSHIEDGWEDYDFWMKFVRGKLDVGFLPEILCKYRVHKTSRTSREALPAHFDLELIMAFRHPV
ncbi:glycosyltransferase [Acetobacter musti]|uniref:Glycosyltransferase n=1 Tax=Acetobacter musti TaxID=864732 RepID=A0ABX0JPE3_9PROT|nr:glycosyltransferase family A protein [Acetobacter musti]NHN85313.1 glycosyltransferase [Acetobacter musti]